MGAVWRAVEPFRFTAEKERDMNPIFICLVAWEDGRERQTLRQASEPPRWMRGWMRIRQVIAGRSLTVAGAAEPHGRPSHRSDSRD